MKKIIVIMFILTSQFVFVNSTVTAANYTDSLLYKVTIWQDGEEIEFEFENPSHYEWEKGTTVIKGDEAQKKVEEIYTKLNITKNTTQMEIKKRLTDNGYPNLERFVVKWIDLKGNLYTWHWNKKDVEAP